MFPFVTRGLKISEIPVAFIIPLYRALVDRGFRVEVGHPKKTRYIAEARIKSDKVDSRAIAELDWCWRIFGFAY
jgi:hypothetical protein